jgi:hypothetical protein
MLSKIPKVTEVPPFSAEANALLDQLASSFTVEQAQLVSQRPHDHGTPGLPLGARPVLHAHPHPRLHVHPASPCR